MPVVTRPITPDELAPFRERMARGFGGEAPADDPEGTRFRELAPLERTVAAFEEGILVGTLADLPFTVTLPGGGTVAMAGTTMVTVLATHRRRGVLTAMMREHLRAVAARGEPLAGLWAAEAPIYGRFGYGAASHLFATTMERLEPTGDTGGGRVRLVEADEAAGLLPPVYEQVRSERPGMLGRSAGWWDHRVLHVPHRPEDGDSARRFAVFATSSGPEGYVVYVQRTGEWTDGIPDGEIRVVELLAATPAAHTALWRFVANIDLFPRLRYWNLPVDDPLPWKVADPRRVRRRLGDALWVRILDVPGALTARTYGVAGRLRLGVEDPFLPEVTGVYELAVESGGATCRRSRGPADVELGVDVLGALLLGGVPARPAAAAGRLRGAPEHVTLLDRMFRGEVAPWCAEVF